MKPPEPRTGGPKAQAFSQFTPGVRAAAPLSVAVFAFGASFGILARTAEMGIIAPLVMSATTFAGSAQFAVASVLAAGGGAGTAVLTGLMLNLRYLPIGISIAPALRGPLLGRALVAQLAVDEAWAVSHVGGGRYDRGRLIGAGVLILAAWLGGTALGVFAGDVLGDPRALGLDAMFPALFAGLLWGQLGSRGAIRAAILGGTISLVAIPLLGPGLPIVAASAAALLGIRSHDD